LARFYNIMGQNTGGFYISDHDLTIVETDGNRIQPFTTKGVQFTAFSPGMRYTALLHTKASGRYALGVNTYFEFLFPLIGSSPMDFPLGTQAIINLDGVASGSPVFNNPPIFPDTLFSEVQQLKGLQHISQLPAPTFNIKLNSSIAFVSTPLGPQAKIFFMEKNGVPVPLEMEACPVILGPELDATIHIPLGAVVRMTIGPGFPGHPIHLHGNHFWVIGADITNTINPSSFVQYPISRDTTMLPFNDDPIGSGWLVIQFVADNPGPWLMHCHFEDHFVTGFGVVLEVGDRNHWPHLPHGFPTCQADFP